MEEVIKHFLNISYETFGNSVCRNRTDARRCACLLLSDMYNYDLSLIAKEMGVHRTSINHYIKSFFSLYDYNINYRKKVLSIYNIYGYNCPSTYKEYKKRKEDKKYKNEKKQHI